MEQDNKMTPGNLGIVFGPTLLRPRPTEATVSLSSLVDYPHQARVVETLITHYGLVFEEEPEEAAGAQVRQPLRGLLSKNGWSAAPIWGSPDSAQKLGRLPAQAALARARCLVSVQPAPRPSHCAGTSSQWPSFCVPAPAFAALRRLPVAQGAGQVPGLGAASGLCPCPHRTRRAHHAIVLDGGQQQLGSFNVANLRDRKRSWDRQALGSPSPLCRPCRMGRSPSGPK